MERKKKELKLFYEWLSKVVHNEEETRNRDNPEKRCTTAAIPHGSLYTQKGY
jgi:hypothetical protein